MTLKPNLHAIVPNAEASHVLPIPVAPVKIRLCFDLIHSQSAKLCKISLVSPFLLEQSIGALIMMRSVLSFMKALR